MEADYRKDVILVIDDEESTCRMLEKLLGDEGYGVAVAYGGEAGINVARKIRPDAVLLDYSMPGMSGIMTCAALKADPELAHIPVIIMTGNTDQEIRMSALNAGAVEFLLKPIDYIELKLRIRNILAFRKLLEADDENQVLSASIQASDAARQEWEDTFDSFDDIITIHDRDYNIIRANKKARELLGIPESQKERKKCFHYYHGSAGPPITCPAFDCIHRGVVSSLEMFEPHIKSHVEIRVIPRIGTEGLVTGYIHIARDITEKKKTLQKLEDAYNELKDAQSFLLQQEKMASIGQLAAGVAHEINNPTGFITSNLGSFQKYVDKLVEFMGVQEQALKELSTFPCSPSPTPSPSGGEGFNSTPPLMGDGSDSTTSFCGDVSNSPPPLRGGDEGEGDAGSINRDRMSTPLNPPLVSGEDKGARGPDEILREVSSRKKALKVDFITEDIRNLVAESLDGAERIKKIVQDLKSFSRVDEAEQKLADINAGIESTINIVWNELKYKATVNKEYGDIPQTKCNPGQLNQVFMNMLVNAAHAIERQGEITIRTWAEDGNIHILIADTGSGIPADKLNRIFEPFYTTKEVGKGTGLGLSIAYDIVKKHKGEINVESEVGKGTTFIVSIPVVMKAA